MDVAQACAIFQRERIADCWDEAADLILANQKETGFDAPTFHANRNWHVEMEKNGSAKLFTMRQDGKLVGYQVFLIYPNPDYSWDLCAAQRTLYIDPAHRGVSSAHFIRFAHGELKLESVKRVFRQVREGGPDYSGLLTHMGFKPTERVYMMELADGN